MKINGITPDSTLSEIEDYSILLLDTAGNIKKGNKGSEKIKGYPQNEIIGSNFRIFYTKEDQAERLPEKLLAEAKAKGKVSTEGWRVRKDGSIFWADVVITALHDSKNNITGYSKMTRDVTEKHKQNESEKNSLGALINNTPDLMWSIDRNYKLISSNRSFDDMIMLMTGKEAAKGSDVLGTGFSDEQLGRWKGFYERVLSGETFTATEYTQTPFEYWSETFFHPICEGDEIVGIACCSHNITDLKKAEQRIVYTNRLYDFLSRMNKAIVHATDERTIYKEACRIAVECGKFKAAWISVIDSENKKVTLLEECGLSEADKHKLTNVTFANNGAQGHVLSTGSQYVCNDLAKDFELPDWKEWGLSRGVHSMMVLPVKEADIIVGSFNLYAAETNFFHEEEIKLLERATEDISYAINVKKKERLKKEADEQLRHSELLLNQSQAITHFGSWEHNFSQPYALWSAEHCRIYGLSPEHNAHSLNDWLSLIHPDDAAYVQCLVEKNIQNKTSGTFSHRIIRKDGSIRHVHAHIDIRLDNGHMPIGLYGVTHDVTEQVIAEKKLLNVNRLYSFSSHVNKTIVRVTDQQTLFNDICRIAVEIGKFEMAWIGALDQPNKTVRLVAEYGANAQEIETFRNLHYDENGFTANLLRKGSYHADNDFGNGDSGIQWKELAIERGFRSAIALPVKKSGQVLFTFSLFSKKPSFFNSEEIALLEEAAADVSFALDVFEIENLRKEAEDKLKHSENRLKQAQEIAHFGNWELNLSTMMFFWSEEACRIYGLGPDDNIHTFESWFDFIHPDDLEYVKKIAEDGLATFTNKRFFYRIIRKDGTVRHIYTIAQFEFNNEGLPAFIFGASHDVTEIKIAENNLRHSELRLKQAQGIAHMGSWERNFSTNVSTWSDEHCKIFGVTPENNLQTFESWLSFIHPEDVARVKAAFIAGRNCLQSVFLNYRIVTEDRAIRHIYSECHFDFNNEGNPIGSYGIAHDITELKEAELKLMNVNRLYAFRSDLSQTIVRTRDEQTLFNEACRIAVGIGKFEMAWIGVSDPLTQTINLIAQSNATGSDVSIFDHLEYMNGGPTASILKNGSCHVINSFDIDGIPDTVKQFAHERGFKSGLAIPVKNTNGACYTLNLFSSISNVFNAEEILLVEQTARDISFALDVFEKEKRKIQAENDLKNSESRLKQAQEIAHFGSWEVNFATGVSTWSAEACRIYGLDPADNLQSFEVWLSFIHPDDLGYVMTVIKEAEANLSDSSYFHRILRRDGTVRHLYSMANYEFRDGLPVGMYGVTHDITDMALAEEALRQSKQNLRMIVDLIPQAIFAKDYNGKFVFVNKSFAEMYGLTPKELINKNIHEMMSGDNDPGYFLKQDQEVIETNEIKIIPESIFTDHTGKKRMFHTFKVPFILAGKNEKAVLGIAIDITDQKQAEAEKAKIVADIIQRNKDLEQFSYIVSHNLRAPVANIIGLSQLMQIAKHDEEDELAMMSGLSTSVKRLDTVIKDLNYILQIKNQLSEKREMVVFNDLLDDILFSIENMIRKENVKITSDFSEINELFTIKSYLYSVFFNLITNSIKYRQPGIQPEITITSSREKNKLELIFSDNGLGIDLDKMGKYVFGLYKRFHNHTEGKGLGLYMVKTQVETLGGKISVLSEVNKGTTFKITFGND